MKTNIQVLSQRGRLIGVWVPPAAPPTNPLAPIAFLRAGPNQKLQEVAVELTEATFRTAKHVNDFHAALRKRHKLRK